MGKHGSMERVDKDLYPTREAWVTEALAAHVDLSGKRVWECAAGLGDMVRPLRAAGAKVFASDIEDRGAFPNLYVYDFTAPMPRSLPQPDGIVTNPPYGDKRKTLPLRFIELAIERIGDGGFVAMLLPDIFDSAVTRRYLFAGCPFFYAKIRLVRRIVWFEPPPGAKDPGPKENHDWYVWYKPASGHAPILKYAP